jgi:DNA polymerase-1
MQEKKLVILDSSSILHRAFHALPPLTTKNGERTEAIYGFCLVLFKIIREIQPNFICACFDFPAKTFRHKEFKFYKISRPPTPAELKEQIKNTKEILKAFEIPYFEKEGFEADDIISTIANKVKEILKIVVSGDQDLFQIVDKETRIYFLQRGIKHTLLIDEKKVAEKFDGLLPEQIPDFKALCGDASDNIPGVKGIGKKTAIKLLLDFENLENLYKEIEKNSEKAKKLKKEIKEALLNYKNQVFFSKSLVQTKKDVPIDFNFEKFYLKYNKEKIIQIFKKFEFNTLIQRLPELEKIFEGENLAGKTLKLF